MMECGKVEIWDEAKLNKKHQINLHTRQFPNVFFRFLRTVNESSIFMSFLAVPIFFSAMQHFYKSASFLCHVSFLTMPY
jgi:hypothetical protein